MIGSVCRLTSLASPEQRDFDGVAVPAVCQCTDPAITVEQTCNWLTGHQGDIEQLLRYKSCLLISSIRALWPGPMHVPSHRR